MRGAGSAGNFHKLATHDVRECLDESWQRVEALRAEQCNSQLCGLLSSRYVDVIENLEVVGQELPRHDEHAIMPPDSILRQEILHVRREPRFWGMSGALVGEPPAVGGYPRSLRHSISGHLQLRQVFWLAFRHMLRKAVGGENHRNPQALLRSQVRKRLVYSFRQGIEEGGLVMPCACDADPYVWWQHGPGVLHSPQVLTQNRRRVLRRYDDSNDVFSPLIRELNERLGDEGGRVTHPCAHAVDCFPAISVELIFERGCLLTGDPC